MRQILCVIVGAFIFLSAGSAFAADAMSAGDQLRSGEFIETPVAANVRLIFQADGNLVLYVDDLPVFASGTENTLGEIAIMQGDGNLVIYDPEGAPLWASGTDGNPGAIFYITPSGEARIAVSGKDIWVNGVMQP